MSKFDQDQIFGIFFCSFCVYVSHDLNFTNVARPVDQYGRVDRSPVWH